MSVVSKSIKLARGVKNALCAHKEDDLRDMFFFNKRGKAVFENGVIACVDHYDVVMTCKEGGNGMGEAILDKKDGFGVGGRGYFDLTVYRTCNECGIFVLGIKS